MIIYDLHGTANKNTIKKYTQPVICKVFWSIFNVVLF